jgi:hypothetical protein
MYLPLAHACDVRGIHDFRSMWLARHIIVLKVWTIIPSNLKQRTISTEELSCFRQVLLVANTGSLR